MEELSLLDSTNDTTLVFTWTDGAGKYDEVEWILTQTTTNTPGMLLL